MATHFWSTGHSVLLLLLRRSNKYHDTKEITVKYLKNMMEIFALALAASRFARSGDVKSARQVMAQA